MPLGKLSVEKRLFSYDDYEVYDDYDAKDVSAAVPSTMSCKLAELPPELHRNIVSFLEDYISVKGSNRKIERRSKPRNQRKNALVHANEDRRRQRRAESIHDLVNWSSTSQYFRRLLKPFVFKTLHLTNDDSSGSSAAALSESQHRKHVKELIFKGKVHVTQFVLEQTLSPPASPSAVTVQSPLQDADFELPYSNPATILPSIVSTVLSSLSRFPVLDTISIELPYEPYQPIFRDPGDEETDDHTGLLETKVVSRALAAQTWEALIQNKNTKLKTLDICRLGYDEISTFCKPAFGEFLSQFTCFKLSIWGMKTCSQTKVFSDFMGLLDFYFFDNLTSVTDFTLKAPVDGPLGRKGVFDAPLVLTSSQMRNITTVFLKYILICPELVQFLVSHQQTLKSLSLHKCSSCLDPVDSGGIPWTDFFDCLYNAKFEKLRHFEVLFTQMPITWREQYPDLPFEHINIGDEEKEVRIKQARRRYEQDEHLRIFPYTIIAKTNGTPYPDVHQNFWAFQRGEDQASYDRFMRKVKINAKKCA